MNNKQKSDRMRKLIFFNEIPYFTDIFFTIFTIIGLAAFCLSNYYIKEECKSSTLRPLMFNSGFVVLWSLFGYFLPVIIPSLTLPFMEILYNVKIPGLPKEQTLEFAKYVAHSFYLFLIILPISVLLYFRSVNAPCKLNENKLKQSIKKLNDIRNKSTLN